MNSCEYLEKCPVFEKCQTGFIKKVFAIKYCQGSELANCERRKLKSAGMAVPLTLLPNGEHMESLTDC